MGAPDLKPDKAGLVPVICYHSWLEVDKETNIEACRHCGLSYELIDSWKRGAPGKGAKRETDRKKVRSGDPKKANIHRPKECGDGDGHPVPIAYVPEEKAIEWGVWPPKTKKEAPVVVTVVKKPEPEFIPGDAKAAEGFTLSPENITPSAPDDTKAAFQLTKPVEIVTEVGAKNVVTNAGKELLEHVAKMPHASARGLSNQEKHRFIIEFKDNILADVDKLGLIKAGGLWGVSKPTLEKLRIVREVKELEGTHPKAEGNLHQKHIFIEKHRAEIIKDCKDLGIEAAGELWGLGKSTLGRVMDPSQVKRKHKAVKSNEQEPKKMSEPKKDDSIKPEEYVKEGLQPVFMKALRLNSNGGEIRFEVTGNVLAFTPADRTFVLDILQRMEQYPTLATVPDPR